MKRHEETIVHIRLGAMCVGLAIVGGRARRRLASHAHRHGRLQVRDQAGADLGALKRVVTTDK